MNEQEQDWEAVRLVQDLKKRIEQQIRFNLNEAIEASNRELWARLFPATDETKPCRTCGLYPDGSKP